MPIEFEKCPCGGTMVGVLTAQHEYAASHPKPDGGACSFTMKLAREPHEHPHPHIDCPCGTVNGRFTSTGEPAKRQVCSAGCA